MGCQHIRRAFTDVFQWRDGGVTKFLQLHIKRDVYVPWGFFFFESEERTFCSHQIFRDFRIWQKRRLGSHTDMWAQAVHLLAV